MLKSYDKYDSELLIRSITELSNSFIQLIDEYKRNDIDDRDTLKFVKDMIKFNENNMPSFFIPIVGMKKKLFDDIPANLSESYDTDSFVL